MVTDLFAERMRRSPPTTQLDACAWVVRRALATMGPVPDSQVRSCCVAMAAGLFGPAYESADDLQKRRWVDMMEGEYRRQSGYRMTDGELIEALSATIAPGEVDGVRTMAAKRIEELALALIQCGELAREMDGGDLPHEDFWHGVERIVDKAFAHYGPPQLNE